MLPNRHRTTRTHTDLIPSTRRRGRSILSPTAPPIPSAPDQYIPPAQPPPHQPPPRSPNGTRFFNERTELEWVLRGDGADRRLVQLALQRAARVRRKPPPPSPPVPSPAPAPAPAPARNLPLPARNSPAPSQKNTSQPHHAPRSVSSEVTALLLPRRRVTTTRTPSAPMHTRHHHHPTSHSHLRPLHNSARDRRVQFRRARNKDAPLSDTVDNPAAPLSSEKYAWYDPEVDHHWRLPIGRPLRTPHPIPSDAAPMAPPSHRCDGSDSTLPYSNGTASEGDVRLARGNSFHPDRSDRRLMSNNARREDSSLRPRDRSGKRIGNRGARWRGLMARKDLVDGTADAYCIDTNDKLHDISPRSSLDIEEATSLFSWDEPPSTSVRGWRSNHSLSYRPQPDRRPRLIKDIGRQRCINDLTNIVVASNEPYVSYDRQIFDPVSKLWTYVEASQPSSSPWELRAVGSPVTCSVSGTDDCVNSSRVAPASASTCPDVSAPPPAVPAASAAAAVSECTKRRNSSPGGLAAITSALEAKRAFMASRDLWLGTTRKSVYGPANLEAVIFASEIDDAEEGILRRASMA